MTNQYFTFHTFGPIKYVPVEFWDRYNRLIPYPEIAGLVTQFENESNSLRTLENEGLPYVK